MSLVLTAMAAKATVETGDRVLLPDVCGKRTAGAKSAREESGADSTGAPSCPITPRYRVPIALSFASLASLAVKNTAGLTRGHDPRSRSSQAAVLLAAASLALAAAAAHGADAYPSRPVRLVVPYAPGGNTDVLARLIGQGLTRSLGQQVVIDNRPGGNTLIGTELVARANPDGYTLLLTTLTHAVTPSLYSKLPYDARSDFTPITLAVRLPNVLVVHPSVPAASLAELIRYARANPGKLSYASTGSGTSPHLSMELLKTMAGIDLVHIPYKGGAPAMTDLVGGQVAAQFIGLPVAVPHIKAGRLRALALTSGARSPAVPDIPTVGETLAGYELDPWFGVLGPRGLPSPIAVRLQTEIAGVLRAPALKDQLVSLGAEPVASTPAEFSAILAAEIRKYAALVKASGARID